jgi:hypothetical protein
VRDHLVDQPIAAAVGDVAFGVAQPLEVADVVAVCQVRRGVLPRPLARGLRVRLDHDRDLRR